MKRAVVSNKQTNNSGSPTKTKKTAKEKCKTQPPLGEPSTSTNSDKSPTKDVRTYIGYGTDQLATIVEQSSDIPLREEVAVAFVEDINYKLRLVINDALTKARLAGRRGITTDDLSDTFEWQGIENIYGVSNQPTWHVIPEQNGPNIHYLDDPAINIFDLAELSIAYIEPRDAVVTRTYFPEKVDNSLKSYFKLMCKAVVEEDKDLRAIALKDIRNNCSIGPIMQWFYNFVHILLSKDVTYEALTVHALELLECLELNAVSGLVISDKQLKNINILLFQRLLRANGTPSLIKPICRLLTFTCRRTELRKRMLKRMVRKYARVKRCFTFPIICLANEFGLDGVMVVIVTNLRYIFHIIRFSSDTGFIHEALRAYHILCDNEIYIENICNQFYDIFDDGIMPFWKNESFPSTELKLEYNWFNIMSALCKSRRKVALPPNYKQKKMPVGEAFPSELEDGSTVVKLIHPTNFISKKSENYVIIGKRTLFARVLKSKVRRPECTYHTMMYHNL